MLLKPPQPRLILQPPKLALRPPPPAGPRDHPATFNDAILAEIRQFLPKGRVLDPFGGVGTLARLGPDWQVTSLEIEPEWANQGLVNGCVEVIVGDATKLPFPNRFFPAVCTSPAYANRLADSYVPSGDKESDKTRRSYRISLGRDLSPDSGASLQWGPEYRALHDKALMEIWRVLEPGGTFVLNVKDHVRDGKIAGVVKYWQFTCEVLKFIDVGAAPVICGGDQNTSRARARGDVVVDHEVVLAYRKPRLDEVAQHKSGWWMGNRQLPLAL